jgi:hypothetical protein
VLEKKKVRSLAQILKFSQKSDYVDIEPFGRWNEPNRILATSLGASPRRPSAVACGPHLRGQVYQKVGREVSKRYWKEFGVRGRR